MSDQFFPYEIDPRAKALLRPLGVSAADGVTLTASGEVVATFGRVKLQTSLANVKHTSVSGPHRWYTALGLRLSFADDGLTMGTNHRKGLCIEFVEKCPKVLGFRAHSALWVSVADPEGLAAAIGC